MIVVTVPTVLANVSGDDIRWPWPAPRYGWPLAWHWRDWQHWYGASTKLDYNFSAARLSANLVTWLIMLAAAGAACEWLLRRYRPQFRWSLRTMLAAIGAIAALCAWYASVSKRADVQDPIISLADQDQVTGHISLYLERSGPKWLDLVGAGRFRRRVVGADLNYSDDRDESVLKRLAPLPDLRYLEIGVSEPTPGMAAALAGLPQVRVLRIGETLFKHNLNWDECIAAIGKLHQLEELHLGEVTDSGSLAYLANLTKLKSLSIRFDWDDEEELDATETNDEASILARLPELPRLEALDLGFWYYGDEWDYLLDEQDVRHLTRQPHLKSLNFSDIVVTDTGLAALAFLPSLEELAIGDDTATAKRLQTLVVLKHLKWLHIQRYTAVDKDTLAALQKQDSLEDLDIAGEGMSETERGVLHVLKTFKELRVKQYGNYDKNDRLTTVSLDRGGQIFALESEVDGFLQALDALREAHPGVVIDADPKWFDPRRGEMRDPELPVQP